MPSSTSSSRGFVLGFLITVTLATVVMAAASEILIRRLVVPVHNFTRYLGLFRAAPGPDAAFGDSIVANGFIGASGFVNLGLGGDNFFGMERKIRLFFADRRAGRVVVQAGLHHLSVQYTRYRDNGEDFRQSLTTGHEPLLKLFDPRYRYELASYWRGLLSSQPLVPREGFAEDGARLNHDNYANYPQAMRHSAAGQVAKLTIPAPDTSEARQTLEHMAGLIEFIRQRGGTTCLVTYPVTRDVRQATSHLPEFKAARTEFSRVASASSVRYVDLYDLDLPDEDFADFTHLNEVGARRLTPRLVDACFGSADGKEQ